MEGGGGEQRKGGGGNVSRGGGGVGLYLKMCVYTVSESVNSKV